METFFGREVRRDRDWQRALLRNAHPPSRAESFGARGVACARGALERESSFADCLLLPQPCCGARACGWLWPGRLAEVRPSHRPHPARARVLPAPARAEPGVDRPRPRPEHVRDPVSGRGRGSAVGATPFAQGASPGGSQSLAQTRGRAGNFDELGQRWTSAVAIFYDLFGFWNDLNRLV